MSDRLAEALRIASKPPALANRFVLIRRLRLSMPPGASAQTIALRIEREWQRVLGAAVFIDEAGASAEVVWAPAQGQARVALLARWLAGEDDSAWFWQRLMPASAPAGLPVAERIAALLIEPLVEEPVAAATASPHWWREALPLLARHGRLTEVLALLPTQPRARLQRLADATGVRDAGPWSAATAVEARPDPELVVGRVPVQTDDAKRTVLSAPGEKPVDETPIGKIPSAAAPDEAHAIKGMSAAGPLRATPLVPAAAASLPAALPVESRSTASCPDASDDVDASRPSPAPLLGQSTAWAGLWLLVPVLLRQGFAAEPLAPGDPQSRHQAEVFVVLLQRLQQRFRLDAVACDWIAAQPSASSEAARIEAETWWLKARHACVRDARLPLLRLLRRPAELLLSDHRIDVVMPLRTLDIRLRRAGFDIDPGYLPWLDAVLRFHYA
ncbi:MAG: hypothetical protein IV092_21445 [Burkholderiaceae bacterium]|nr:hypothetical protein [Burkholderiaceae bacterium]